MGRHVMKLNFLFLSSTYNGKFDMVVEKREKWRWVGWVMFYFLFFLIKIIIINFRKNYLWSYLSF